MNHWDLSQFENKNIVFIGKGKGRAMAGIENFLRNNCNILSFNGVDEQASNNPYDFLTSYDLANTAFIKNEGVPGHKIPVPYTTPLKIFFNLVKTTKATTVGITGTKGKSTTAALTAHILKYAGKKAVLAGNIGVSPFNALNEATEDTIFVLELSSYQLADLAVSPHISACINLFQDHTDWHGSLEKYWDAKHNIVRFATADDMFIYNPDFAELRSWADHAACQTRPIDPNEPFDLSNAKLFGDHNRLNALIAREIARCLNVQDDLITKAVNSFEPLEHRTQYIATKNTRIYIDDAIGMTPESTLASIQAVTDKYGPIGCLLLGGQDRDYDFAALMQKISELHIPNLVFFPDTVQKMRQHLPDNYHPAIFETSDMDKAVRFAADHAPENSVVLLSTAAPSYSLWRDFEEKGNQFQAAVANL